MWSVGDSLALSWEVRFNQSQFFKITGIQMRDNYILINLAIIRLKLIKIACF